MVNRLNRRTLLGVALGAALPFINPGRDPSGRLHIVRPAEAGWLAAASLAISAISAFSKSGDGGLGAYLGNIKKLSEENIRLSQDILVRVADIQAQLQELPDRLRTIFIEVSGYRIAQQTQTALNYLLEVEASGTSGWRMSRPNRQKCEEVLRVCAELAGARAAAYGIGGTAASCLPMIAAVDARAHYFLNRSQDYRNRVRIAYLPWLDDILSDRDYSLQRSLIQEGEQLAGMTRATLSTLPAAQREAMQAQWEAIVKADPGSSSADFVLACGSYGIQTGTRKGRCIETMCTGDPYVLDSGTRRIVQSARLDVAELMEMSPENRPPAFQALSSSSLLSSDTQSLASALQACYCATYERVPTYTATRDSQLVGRLRTIPSPDGSSAVRLEKNWTQRSPARCGISTAGTDASATGQATAVQTQYSALSESIAKFESRELAAYNEQRALVFTTFKLLDAMRATRAALVRVVA